MVNLFEKILESIGEGLIAIDKEKKIIVVNKAAENMLGWKMKYLVGQHITNLALEDEKGDLVPLQKWPIMHALSGTYRINTKYFFVRKDKTRFPISMTATPIRFGREVVGSVSIFRDISEERAIDKAKSEFIYIASHGLMTPLSVAKLYLESIKRKDYLKNAPENIKEYIDEIYKSNGRSIALVRNLLSVSRIDQGKIQDTPEKINIKNLIEKVIKEMGTIAQRSNVSLDIKTKKKIPEIYIDPQHLREVIENLITNAIKYNVPGGKVEIDIEKKSSELLLTVQDTGIGISNTDKRRLFAKFFRTEKAALTNAEGSGLGLYVTKSYVERWGGKISIKSEEGKGSTFLFTIPVGDKKTSP